MATKESKKKIIENIASFLKKCNIFKLSDKSFGFFLRAFHVNLPLYLVIFMIYGTKVQNILILFGLMLAFVSFIYFNGCVLSKVEKTVDGEDITIIDPFLNIFNMEKTTKNRMIVSYVIVFFYLSFAILTFNYRFGFSITFNDFTEEYNNSISHMNNVSLYLSSFFLNNSYKRQNNDKNDKKEYQHQPKREIIPFDEISI